MDVEVWYSRWRTFQEGISVPTQWDVRRAGAPYKRISVQTADFDPEFTPADSFAVSPELRAAYAASPAVRPMHDLSLDSARVVEDVLVDFRTFGSPGAAVRLGDGWLMVEAGQAPLSTERAMAWLERNVEGPLVGAVVGAAAGGMWPHGGLPALLAADVPVVVGPGTEPFARATLVGYGMAGASLDVEDEGRWIRRGDDSVRVEAVDLPDAPGSLVVWAPRHGWLWSPDAATPLDWSLILEQARSRGWEPRWLGSPRAVLREREPTGDAAEGSGAM